MQSNAFEVGRAVSPILVLRKLRFRKRLSILQSHATRKWWDWLLTKPSPKAFQDSLMHLRDESSISLHLKAIWAISWGGEGSKFPRIVREGGASRLSNATNRYLLYLGPPQSLSACGCREHWCFSWVWWALAVEQGLETERGIDGEIAFTSESCVSVPAFPPMSVSNNRVMVFHFEEFICPRGFVSFCLAFEGSESFQARRTLRHHLLNPSFDRRRNWASEKARGSSPSVITFPGGRAGAWNPSLLRPCFLSCQLLPDIWRQCSQKRCPLKHRLMTVMTGWKQSSGSGAGRRPFFIGPGTFQARVCLEKAENPPRARARWPGLRALCLPS